MTDDMIDARLFNECLTAQGDFNAAAAEWRQHECDRRAAEARLIDLMTTRYRLVSKTRRLIEARGGGVPDIITDPGALAIIADIEAGRAAREAGRADGEAGAN